MFCPLGPYMMRSVRPITLAAAPDNAGADRAGGPDLFETLPWRLGEGFEGSPRRPLFPAVSNTDKRTRRRSLSSRYRHQSNSDWVTA